MRWVFLIQFCVGCWYTIASGFQLSYTPRCGKELLFSFVEECVTASTGLPILPPCHASFSRRRALRAGAPPFPCGSNRAGAKCVSRTGENCTQGGARAGRTASRWERPAHGRKLRAGRRAGRTGGKQMERPAHGQKLRAGRRGRTGGKQMGASGAHGRKLRAGRRACWTGGKQMERPAHGQKLRAGRRAGRTGGKQMGASGAHGRKLRARRRACRADGKQMGASRARGIITRRKERMKDGRQTNGSVSRTGDNYA